MSIESKELIESLIDRHESLESYAYLLGILGFIYNQLGNHVLGLEYCKTGFGKHARLNSNFYHTTNSI